MRNIKLLVVALMLTALAHGQHKPEDSPNFEKTKHKVTINNITYFVYKYKTGEYFTIRENKRTGRKYWQPLEMVEPRKLVSNKLTQDEKRKKV